MKVGEIIATEHGAARVVLVKDDEVLLRLEPVKVTVDGKEKTEDVKAPWRVRKVSDLLSVGVLLGVKRMLGGVS